jgi:hypothetical protein
MKRLLSWKEIEGVIEFEDRCGINDTLQQILTTHNKPELILGKDYNVEGNFNDKGELGEITVIRLENGKMRIRHNLQWFLDRVGKRIYRKKLKCPCKECQKTYLDIASDINGLGRTHANYLYDCQNELGIEYFDEPVKTLSQKIGNKIVDFIVWCINTFFLGV